MQKENRPERTIIGNALGRIERRKTDDRPNKKQPKYTRSMNRPLAGSAAAGVGVRSMAQAQRTPTCVSGRAAPVQSGGISAGLLHFRLVAAGPMWVALRTDAPAKPGHFLHRDKRQFA